MADRGQKPQAPTTRKGLRSLPEISFHRGLNTLKVNRLLLEQGECAALLNPDMNLFGGMGIEKTIETVKSGYGPIHSLFASGNYIWVGHGPSLSVYNKLDMTTEVVVTGLTGAPLTMEVVGNFLYLSNGSDKRKVYIPTLAVTTWGIDAPPSGPTVAAGAASTISGVYRCFFTYVAKYPDGTEYETDLSPVAGITVSSTKINWTLPGSAADAQITHLRLYRDKDGLSQSLDTLRENVEAKEAALGAAVAQAGGAFKAIFNRITNKKAVQDSVVDQNIIIGPFEVAEVTIATTSYVDDVLDAVLQENLPFVRERYLPVKSYTRMIHRGKRIFGIGVYAFLKYLWYGNPYEPQALESSWDGYNTTTFEDENNVSLHELQSHLYIGSKVGFMRLRGASPGDFALDPTPSTVGPESNDTCQVTPFGIIFPRRDGMYLFTGYTSGLIAPQIKNLLENVNWTEIDVARSVWDGRFYRLFYPSGEATQNDRELVLDLIAGLKDVRCGEGDRAVSAVVFDKATQTVYYGTIGGILGTATGSGSRALEIETKEYVSEDLLTSGTIGVLHFDADTKGVDVTITPIYDGVDQTPFTINTNGRTKSQESLPKGNFFRLGFRIEVTTDKDVILYEPWLLE